MSDSPVTLDGFEFRDFEVPEHFPFGGSQKISEKNLIGGVRIADAMGALNRPVEWSGRFQGQDAMSRALELDAKRKAGKDLPLAWGDLAFTVKIVDFLPDAEKAFEIPFSITLMVVSDDTQPLTAGDGPTVDEVMSSDMDDATVLGDRIGDAPLSGLLGDLTTAMGSVRSFASAGQTALAGVLAPISAVQARVQALIGETESVFAGSSGLGGVVPGVSPLNMASSLVAQADAMTKRAVLHDLGSLI